MSALALTLTAGMLSPSNAVAGEAPQAKASIEKSLQNKLDSKGTADLWVVFDEKADLTKASAVKDWTARGDAVVKALQATASESQAKAKETLKAAGASFTPYWASNRILVRDATEALTDKLAALPGVSKVAATRTWAIDPPAKGKAEKEVNAVEWGIAAINADDVWGQYDVRGEGITVASVDSGVQFDHPAVVGKYRGNQGNGTFDHNYNWFDPSRVCGNPSLAPCDNNSHGTHTMGTMVGDDGGSNQIGVAPGARWIAAKGCESNGCSDTALLASGQWMLAPTDLNGQNPRADLRPNIVNNSWGASNGSAVDPWYDDIVTGWTASGIFGIFSNGNAGPGCDTAGSPADSPFAYGVGAFNSGGAIASFSSRGPGANNLIRPNVSAPGVNVRSSVPTNGYANFDGTSMAAPHVAGAVALVWSAAPALVGDIEATRTLLNETAVDVSDLTCGGTAGNNNVWGEGKVDALAAVTAAPRGDTGVLTGTITDAGDGDPIAGAKVDLEGPLNRSTTTGPDGTYSLTLSVGDYSIDVHAFGYTDASGTATVTTGETTTKDFALVAAPSYGVTGTIADARGQPVSGVKVSVEGTPIPPVTTNAEGAYAFESVPAGSYTLKATASGCLAAQSKDVVVDAAKVVDFALADRTDNYGYRCVVEPSAYVEGDTALSLSGDDASAVVDLPFPVVFYGQSYSRLNASTNGHLSFTAASTSYANSPIPSTTPPNGAIYPFWDDLLIDASAKLYTKAIGQAPNRSFVLEWRNALIYGTQGRVDAEVVLKENGDIVLAWRNIDPALPAEQGLSATAGIENPTGTDALQYSHNSAVLSDSAAVRFTLPPNGFVKGTVTDKNDGNPVANATVKVTEGDTTVRELKTGADGTYLGQVWVGSYTLTVEARNYTTSSSAVSVADGQTVTKNFALTTARAELDVPEPLKWVLPEGNKQEVKIPLSNTGSANLEFEVAESGGGRVTATTPQQSATLAAKADPNALTAKERYSSSVAAAAVPQAPGDVLASWPAQGLSPAWGVGYAGTVWISDPNTKRNHEFSTAGAATGRTWNASWAGTWNADMAYDSRRGQMCQVNVGGDNGIYCWDQATGTVSYKLTGSPWAGISQRGLAYRADDDSFYIAGWNQDVIYHVAGASHATPGATLGQCAASAGTAVAGLAYNNTAGVLWVTTNTPTSPILQLNPATCEVISSFGFPEQEQYAGAGAELDSAGNLWVTSQVTNTAYLIETGVPESSDVPWLSVAPASGTIAPGGSKELTVTVDTTGLAAGVYRANLLVQTNSGRQPNLQVPVEIVVAGYWKGVDVGGAAYTDTKLVV